MVRALCFFLYEDVPYRDTYRHIDGHDYMYALSEMLESAREAIFILVRRDPRVP